MYNNDTMWQINRERRSELTKVAQDQKFLRKPENKSPVKDQLFVNLGDLLVSFGTRLKTRHESATR